MQNSHPPITRFLKIHLIALALGLCLSEVRASSWSASSATLDPSGGILTLQLEIEHPFVPTAFGIEMALPGGWLYLSDDSDAAAKPAANDSGILEWLWIVPPPDGARVAIQLSYPANLSGTQALSATLLRFDAAGNVVAENLPPLVFSGQPPEAPPVLGIARGANGVGTPGFRLSFLSAVGAQYQLYVSGDLQDWSAYGSVLLGSGAVLDVAYPFDPPTPGALYFKIKRLSP